MMTRNQFSFSVGRCAWQTRSIALFVFSLCLTACDRESSASGTPAHSDRVESEHAERSVFYHDMLEAYERGDYKRARGLAREYLIPAYDKLVAGKKEGWGKGLRVLGGMLVNENRLPPENRFGGDEEFAAWLQEVLLASRDCIRSTQVKDPSEKAGRQQLLKFAARQWILARRDHVSREGLEELYSTFRPELEKPGYMTRAFTSLDDLLAPPETTGARQSDRVLNNDEIDEIAGIIHSYFEGLVARDVRLLESATGLDKETCGKLLAAYDDDCAEEGIVSIRSVTLPRLSADHLRLHPSSKKPGFYTLTVKGIRLDTVQVDGSAASRVISKHLTVREQATGRWIIVAPKR